MLVSDLGVGEALWRRNFNHVSYSRSDSRWNDHNSRANVAHQPPRANGMQHETRTSSRGQAACAGSAIISIRAALRNGSIFRGALALSQRRGITHERPQTPNGDQVSRMCMLRKISDEIFIVVEYPGIGPPRSTKK